MIARQLGPLLRRRAATPAAASTRPLPQPPRGSCRCSSSGGGGSGSFAKVYGLSGVSVGKAGCDVTTSTGFTISSDTPVPSGGRNAAPQPVELMLGALLGCETATAHFVARQLWPRPHNRIDRIEWQDVTAERDERGALSLPITQPAPVPAGLTRVRGVALVVPAAVAPRRGARGAGGDAAADQRPSPITEADVVALGEIVEERCPVAAMFAASGCELDFEWRLLQQG